MKAKQKLQRFLSIFLACVMILNVPMSALAFEDVQIVDVVEEAEIVADEELSSDEVIFTDEEVVEEAIESEEQVLDNSAVELSLFEDESPELGESIEITGIEEVIMDTVELFSSGNAAPTTEIPFTVSVNGETVELEDGGVDESDKAQYCDASAPKKVIAKVPAGTTSVTIANEASEMMIMDTSWHNFLNTGTKNYTAEVGEDGAVYCILVGEYYHLYIEVEEKEEVKLTDVNLIVPESLTAEADGVTYKYVTGERCTFSYETVPAGLETTQKWNLQDTNGNKLNWETPTMSWTFSGGEWTLELSVTYGEDTITKTIYLKEGGESGEGGETPDAPTTEIPFTVSVNGETIELEDGGIDESDKAQYCDASAPKKVIAKVPAGTTSVTIVNEASEMMIMDTSWHNFLNTGTKNYTAEVGEDGAVYCILVGEYYHLYIEVEEKEEVKLGSYISITTDMDGEVTVTEEETDMFFPVYKTVVPRGSGYAYFTFPANTIYTFENSAKVTLKRTGHSPDKYYQAITNVDGSVTVKLLITDIYTGALDEETIACFWKPDGTSVLEGYSFEYSNDMSILLVGLAVGNGYTTNGATYVKNGEDYTFTIDVKNGYDATNMVVKVNGEPVTPDEDGIYTVKEVTEDLDITVEGVEPIPVDGDVTVYFTMENHDKFVEQGGTVWALEKVTIPYFDLANYGMEYLYYNPNCYTGGSQTGGTKETADGVVTLLHMMIWLTEVYYNDVDPEDAGQGYLANELNWRGFSIHHATAGSAFFNIWDFGYNFNYYLNYEYPLGSPGWGSTCDQIKLSDNDVVTIRYNDNSGNVGTYHHFGENGIVEKSVTQGTSIDLNIYYTGVDNVNYTTPVYKVGEGHKVYMFPEYDVYVDPTEGTYVGVTDTDGKVTVNTAELEVGRYHLVSDSMSPAVMLLEIQENTNLGAVELANAKTDAKTELANYKNADNYREAEKTALAEVVEAAEAAIDEAETIEAVTEIVTIAKAEMDAIKTDEQLKKEEAESEAEEAQTVANIIDSLPAADQLTAADADKVEAARAAYDALTDAQKALVSPETLKQLEAAETKIAELTHVHSWDAGTVTKAATCKETGVKTFKCSCGETKTETIAKTASHKYGAWTVESEATVKAAEVQKHICFVCGNEETKDVGEALTPVLEIPGKLSSFNMKKGKTAKFEVSMANGDSVSSVKSSKTKILKATLDKKTGKVTVKGLKKGTSKLTITLASGKSRTYTVKVVTGTVKTKGLSVTNVTDKKLTLAVKKTHTLQSELKPFTSTQKLTYKSSNKKIAKVSSKGKITAVAPGKATITVSSGSKKVKITVTVPGIANVKSSVSVKKNKTLTLKPKTYGIGEKVTYTSSNTKVATVTANGKIKGIKKGTAKITVKAGTFKKTVTVKVK